MIAPSTGGPAEKAGIQPGDVVLAIDGKSTAGSSLYDTGEALQGPEGSEVLYYITRYTPSSLLSAVKDSNGAAVQVTLTIQPHDGASERDVVLARQKLTFNPVTSQLCKRVPWSQQNGSSSSESGADETIGYIRVATFNKQTSDSFKSALTQLQSEGASR